MDHNTSENQTLPFSRHYYITNEILNAVTHGIGFILSIIATIFLIYKGVQHDSPLEIAAYAIYGLSMCLLYLASTLYHSLTFTKAAGFLKIIDHSSIFLLIAGTYTPFCLIAVQGKLGWSIFIIEWLIAISGIAAKIFFFERTKKISTLIYILMGWFVIFALDEVVAAVGAAGVAWMIAGGLAYTIGTFFYSHHQRRYWHVIWHLFVLLGSASMFFAIWLYV